MNSREAESAATAGVVGNELWYSARSPCRLGDIQNRAVLYHTGPFSFCTRRRNTGEAGLVLRPARLMRQWKALPRARFVLQHDAKPQVALRLEFAGCVIETPLASVCFRHLGPRKKGCWSAGRSDVAPELGGFVAAISEISAFSNFPFRSSLAPRRSHNHKTRVYGLQHY